MINCKGYGTKRSRAIGVFPRNSSDATEGRYENLQLRTDAAPTEE